MADHPLPTQQELEAKYAVPSIQKPQEPMPVKQVVKGPVTRKKRSLGQRFADAFLGPDIVDVKDYILQTAVVPTIKRILCEIPEMLFFGRSSYNRGYGVFSDPRMQPNVTAFRYDKIGFQDKPRTNMYGQPVTQNYMFDDIILSTAMEAEALLREMFTYVSTYGYVSVAQVNGMLRQPSQFTDNDWGWRNLSQARIQQVRGGYQVMLPRCIYIK